MDAVLAFAEITDPDNSDQKNLKSTGLRVVQHRRLHAMDKFDSENTTLTSPALATEEERGDREEENA